MTSYLLESLAWTAVPCGLHWSLMRESLSLAVSPAPLQDRHMEVIEEGDRGKHISTLREQYGKSARNINARKITTECQEGKDRETAKKSRNWTGLDMWRNL